MRHRSEDRASLGGLRAFPSLYPLKYHKEYLRYATEWTQNQADEKWASLRGLQATCTVHSPRWDLLRMHPWLCLPRDFNRKPPRRCARVVFTIQAAVIRVMVRDLVCMDAPKCFQSLLIRTWLSYPWLSRAPLRKRSRWAEFTNLLCWIFRTTSRAEEAGKTASDTISR